jgi:hypothetical protein
METEFKTLSEKIDDAKLDIGDVKEFIKRNIGCGMPINRDIKNPDWSCGDFLEENVDEEGRSLGKRYFCDRCNKLIKEAGDKLA